MCWLISTLHWLNCIHCILLCETAWYKNVRQDKGTGQGKYTRYYTLLNKGSGIRCVRFTPTCLSSTFKWKAKHWYAQEWHHPGIAARLSVINIGTEYKCKSWSHFWWICWSFKTLTVIKMNNFRGDLINRLAKFCICFFYWWLADCIL